MASLATPSSRPSLGALRYRARKLLRYANVPQYLWYHKQVFGVSNTKFDISFCVFEESFRQDQYGIRAFLDRLGAANELLFLDIGRNHGLVFYYAMYHIMKQDLPVKTIHYYGIDPSPLKFVYFNFHDYLRAKGITIHHHIIDRAVVFNDDPHVTLKYGDNNFGNFHVAGSNYAEASATKQSKFEYINITVDTIRFDAVKDIVRAHAGSDAVIVKIDCKNRTDHMFAEMLDLLGAGPAKFLVAAEQDGSSDRDLSAYVRPGHRTLTTSSFG